MKKAHRVSTMLMAFLMVLMLFIPAASAASGESVVLRYMWWGSNVRHQAILAAAERYHELNPNITIEGEYSSMDGYYQKLVTQFAGGIAPDIITIDYPWITDFAAQGVFLEDLNSYSDLIALDRFEADYLRGWCYNGDRLEGLPCSLNGYTMFFNQKVVNMAGIDLTADSQWTWDKLIAEGEKFVAAYPDYVFLHSDPSMLEKNIFKPYLIQTYGGQYINDDLTIPCSKANLVQTYNFLLELLDKGLIQPLSETTAFDNRFDQNPVWANGQAALCIRWCSDTIQLINGNVDIQSARLPVIAGSTDTAINAKPAMLLTLYAGSKHKEEAVRFINWMLTDDEGLEIIADKRGVPATAYARKLLSSKELLNPVLVQSVEVAAANAGTPQNGYNDNSEITSISVDIMGRVLYKEITPDQAADEYLQRVGEKLKSMQAD